MNIVYTAPNRAHHYHYATAMHQAGVLHSFVSGFSRFSPRSQLKEIGKELYRADILQTIYIGSLKLGLSTKISSTLAYLSKIEQDIACKKFLNNCDIFLFYNGSGLISCQHAKRKGIVTIVEAVNSHVLYQEQILFEEHQQLNLSWTPFHKQEKERRIREYALADYILIPSEFVKKSFLNLGFPEHKLLKVPYGFNRFSPTINQTSSNSEGNDFTVLYVGSISVRKGLRYLIQAFDKLQHPRKKLILVGPRSDIDGISDLSIPAEVVFTGVLKGEVLEKVYSTATVFCLPSIEEGFGLVLGEALSFGLPIVTTTNTAAYDLITDGDEGFIVPIKDSDSLTEKLQLLADDTVLYQKMRASAKKKSQELNGWEENYQLLISTLYSVTNK